MSRRRDAREWAVQILFQRDFNPDTLDTILGNFWADKPASKTRAFAEELVRGVVANIAAIDAAIQTSAENWDLARMGGVERNVMRVAVYEMLMRADIPPVVSINEAVDIAKDLSDLAAGRFVNGILDKVRKGLDRPLRTAANPGPGGEPKA